MGKKIGFETDQRLADTFAEFCDKHGLVQSRIYAAAMRFAMWLPPHQRDLFAACDFDSLMRDLGSGAAQNLAEYAGYLAGKTAQVAAGGNTHPQQPAGPEDKPPKPKARKAGRTKGK